MILVVDNYDSFTFNLGRYLVCLGAEAVVVRNDALTLDGIADDPPDAIVLSPGPGAPGDAGICENVIRAIAAGALRRTDGSAMPLLGVCLGHQALASALGGRVVVGEPRHGRPSEVVHDGTGLFTGMPNPFTAGRYHSLHVLDEGLPPDLDVTARTHAGTIMGLAHRRLPLYGVQFHPESLLTVHGPRLIANFLVHAGVTVLESSVHSLIDANDQDSVSGQPKRSGQEQPDGSTHDSSGIASGDSMRLTQRAFVTHDRAEAMS